MPTYNFDPPAGSVSSSLRLVHTVRAIPGPNDNVVGLKLEQSLDPTAWGPWVVIGEQQGLQHNDQVRFKLAHSISGRNLTQPAARIRVTATLASGRTVTEQRTVTAGANVNVTPWNPLGVATKPAGFTRAWRTAAAPTFPLSVKAADGVVVKATQGGRPISVKPGAFAAGLTRNPDQTFSLEPFDARATWEGNVTDGLTSFPLELTVVWPDGVTVKRTVTFGKGGAASFAVQRSDSRPGLDRLVGMVTGGGTVGAEIKPKGGKGKGDKGAGGDKAPGTVPTAADAASDPTMDEPGTPWKRRILGAAGVFGVVAPALYWGVKLWRARHD